MRLEKMAAARHDVVVPEIGNAFVARQLTGPAIRAGLCPERSAGTGGEIALVGAPFLVVECGAFVRRISDGDDIVPPERRLLLGPPTNPTLSAS